MASIPKLIRIFQILFRLYCLYHKQVVLFVCERDVVHRMNEGYRAWGAVKSVLSNRGLGTKAKKCL